MADIKIEKYTEKLVEQEMKITAYGENDFGFVYVQGELTPNSDINEALKNAGGKPKDCSLDDFSIFGHGKAKPEYLITLKHDLNTIIVVECKNSVKKHVSKSLGNPRDYAVDGVLYYTKYLKSYFNVIAVAISGSKKADIKVDAFYWAKNQTAYTELTKAKNIILEPDNYLKLVRGEKVQKAYSLAEVKATAVNIHDSLRINKMTEKLKPLFVAGVLIALQDEDFSNDYDKITSFNMLLDSGLSAIERVLSDEEISTSKIREIKSKFSEIGQVIKLRATPLSDDHSLRWYINQLEMKIKPMMDYVGNTIDALGIFYHEFISYSSGDGNSLGIVLTPQHLTEFMVELINIDKDSRVVDICCGSGAFLVTAMGKMFKEAVTLDEIEYIRKNNLYGIEQDSDIHTLALANMIMRKDGKSHILHGDCFDKNTIKKFKNLKDSIGNPVVLNKGLLNPPYSQKDHVELEFLEQELELICQGGEVAVVCPMSCAIGTKFKDVRERLMQKHTLKAVFSMPDDIFYGQGAGTCVCVMVWEAKKKHDPSVSTFFGYYKDDGFVKRKKLGRVDVYKKWESIKNEWLRLYREKEVVDGLTAKACVNHKNEWLCEAYMKTDFSILSKQDFQQSVNDYISYLVKNEYTDLKQKYKREKVEMRLEVDKWEEFKIDDLFTVSAGKYHYSYEYDNGLTPYVSASNANNGVAQKINLESDFNGNCLVTGKVGCTAFYQPFDFCATSDVNILNPKFELNYSIGLFIVTVINKGENYKWNYGRQCRVGDSKEIVIKLPIKKNSDGKPYVDQKLKYSKKGYVPDWHWIENYIKQLKYCERI